MNKLFHSSILILVNLLLTQSAQAAGAAINSANLLDNILQRFSNTASGWGTHMVTYASWLFWGLTLISMVWTYSFMALKKADIQEFFAETIRFFVTTGFFFWILQNGPAIAIAIMDTCRQMAAQASGLNKSISPSGIVDIGFDIASKVVDQSSIWSPATSTVGLIIAAVILIVLALVSVNLLVILISGWLIAYGGVFLLGFGGGRWTQDIAISYYKEVLGIGMHMFAMVLLVGIGRSFIDQYYAAIGNDMAFKELLVMLVVAIVLLTLVDKIPPLFARMVGGTGGGGGGLGNFGLGAAAGAAGMAGAMATGAASGVLGAATSMAGGGSALKAAFEAAQHSMSQSSQGQGVTNRTAGSLTSAMGMASEMGSYLAKGSSQTFNDKLDSIKEAAQERMSGTVGGKVAEAIHQMSPENTNNSNLSDTPYGASNEGQVNYSFSGDTLSGGAGNSNTDNQCDEIEEFVNKSSNRGAGDEL